MLTKHIILEKEQKIDFPTETDFLFKKNQDFIGSSIGQKPLLVEQATGSKIGMIQYQPERLEEIDELANKNKLNMVKGQITNGFTDRPMIKGGTHPKAIKQDPNSSKLFNG